MASMNVPNKPHALFIPFPLQSHIKTMLKLAKILYFRGFHITFVNTEFNHNRFLHARGPNSMDGLPDFQFETIPDSLPPSDLDYIQDVPSLCESVMKNFLQPFLDLVVKIKETASSRNVPPLTCIIADGFTSTFTVEAAQQLQLPIVILFTMCASAIMGFKHYAALKDKGIIPLKDESYLTNGYLDSIVDWIPGMRGIRLRDLPSLLRTTNSEDVLFNFTMECAENAAKASAVGFNTLEPLEKDVLASFSSIFPPVYAIGPLQFHLNKIQEMHTLDFVGYSLWKENIDCLPWLDSFDPNSVVYVNFGSVTIMTPEQLIEFGMGLANSKHPFLWIIRRDLVIGDWAILPPEFFEETRERSMIVLWCPQEEVLNHPSIGGFLTHSGWNSTLESLSAGVPMLCWPFFADQTTNCKYSCNEWGVGMEIDNNVKRDEVEKHVRELMEGEKGKEMRKKAMEWKKIAEEGTRPNGSSSLNLDKLIDEVLLPKC